MSENTNNNAVLTEKEIFDQIVLLQKQLTEQSQTSLHRLGEAIYDACGEGEDARISDEQVASICAVFAQREETLSNMLALYQRMYSDLQQEKKKDAPPSIDEKRKQYLDFVQQTITSVPGPGVLLPDFEMIWQNVFLGQEKSQSKDEPLTRDDKIEKITMIQHSILEMMQNYQSEEELELLKERVAARLDALCTDILEDRI